MKLTMKTIALPTIKPIKHRDLIMCAYSSNKIMNTLLKARKLDCSLVNPFMTSQPAITCSTLTIKTLEQGVKYVQS